MGVFGEPMALRYLSWLLEGFAVTLLLSAAVSVAATGLGIAVCGLKLSGRRPLVILADTYVSIIRNTPLLVQLFFWYFGASALMPSGLMTWLNTPHVLDIALVSLHWPAFETIAGFFGLTLYAGAYIAEEFRAGINGVDPAQRESAMALGLRPALVFWLVVLPQAVRIAWLPVVGQYLNTIKNTSLTMAIGLAELSYASRQVETETFLTFQAFGIATILYVAAVAVTEAAGHAVARSGRFAWATQRP
ncbi:putative glutamine ABC transporter permease protein GlnM [Starkeya nomas]|uniref:Putative glutamine ABC transporter permease protein GlnM n=1 Tax=Starkeya nomas TaxID=2666134 RepID=A0A5S9PAC6_9HYPH|nr:amino acid ABC transporter permease [Starkeya nomas]CAA0100500.1 putative glutamine ABC transporter permease protein GlnM [Starkeya nomas]